MICVRCDNCDELAEADLETACECPGSFARIPAPRGWLRVDGRHYCGDACREEGEHDFAVMLEVVDKINADMRHYPGRRIPLDFVCIHGRSADVECDECKGWFEIATSEVPDDSK